MGNLALPTIAAGQNNKYQTSNDADDALDEALTAWLSVDLSGGDATLLLAQLQSSIYFVTSGNSVARTLTITASARLFAVKNGGSFALSVTVGTTTIALAAGASAIFYADGTANGLVQIGVSSGGGGGGSAGAVASFTTAAGSQDDIDPGSGWPTGFDRLDLDLSAGAAQITSLKAGTDGQKVIVSNRHASNLGKLMNDNGSAGTAANRFDAPGDMDVPPKSSKLIVFYGGGVNRWRFV